MYLKATVYRGKEMLCWRRSQPVVLNLARTHLVHSMPLQIHQAGRTYSIHSLPMKLPHENRAVDSQMKRKQNDGIDTDDVPSMKVSEILELQNRSQTPIEVPTVIITEDEERSEEQGNYLPVPEAFKDGSANALLSVEEVNPLDIEEGLRTGLKRKTTSNDFDGTFEDHYPTVHKEQKVDSTSRVSPLDPLRLDRSLCPPSPSPPLTPSSQYSRSPPSRHRLQEQFSTEDECCDSVLLVLSFRLKTMKRKKIT